MQTLFFNFNFGKVPIQSMFDWKITVYKLQICISQGTIYFKKLIFNKNYTFIEFIIKKL